MKNITKIFATIILLVITSSNFAQADKSKFYQKMGQNLGQFAACQSIEDFNNLSNQFARIAQVEKEEWLPLYYAAHCKIIMSFMENEDKVKKEAYLDEADIFFENLEKLAPQESEVYALKALCYTARLVVDPATRGQEYSMKIQQEAGKSLAINADNPRAQYIILSNEIGFAKFFGKETVEECKRVNILFENWDSLQSENSLMPSWGKDLVSGMVKSCK